MASPRTHCAPSASTRRVRTAGWLADGRGCARMTRACGGHSHAECAVMLGQPQRSNAVLGSSARALATSTSLFFVHQHMSHAVRMGHAQLLEGTHAAWCIISISSIDLLAHRSMFLIACTRHGIRKRYLSCWKRFKRGTASRLTSAAQPCKHARRMRGLLPRHTRALEFTQAHSALWMSCGHGHSHSATVAPTSLRRTPRHPPASVMSTKMTLWSRSTRMIWASEGR
jgi:hypothetical protein